MKPQIAADTRYLDQLASLHSLDPFLFKMKAEQIEIHEDIHELNFAISKEEWERIRIPIREKISKLMTKVLGEGRPTKTMGRSYPGSNMSNAF